MPIKPFGAVLFGLPTMALSVLLAITAVEIPSAWAQDNPNILSLKCSGANIPGQVVTSGPWTETYTIDFQQGSVTTSFVQGSYKENSRIYVDGQPTSDGWVLTLSATDATIEINLHNNQSNFEIDDTIDRITGQLSSQTEAGSYVGTCIKENFKTAF